MSKHRANTATDERPLVRHTCTTPTRLGEQPEPAPCPACLPGRHRQPGTVRQHRLRAEREAGRLTTEQPRMTR